MAASARSLWFSQSDSRYLDLRANWSVGLWHGRAECGVRGLVGLRWVVGMIAPTEDLTLRIRIPYLGDIDPTLAGQ